MPPTREDFERVRQRSRDLIDQANAAMRGDVMQQPEPVMITRDFSEELVFEDPVLKFKREADEQEARFEAARAARRRRDERERRAADRSADDARLLELVDSRIEWHLDALTKAIAQAESEIRSALRDELRREFKEQLAELRGEMKGRFAALDPKR